MNLPDYAAAVESFTVCEEKGGTYGVMGFFSVGQANQEDLPNTPVVVSYRITDAELHRK